MFSLHPVLENRYVVRKIRGSGAIHFISTFATRQRAWHTLWLASIPALPDFLLKLLFAEHISSVCLCHLSSLPQVSGREEMFFQIATGGPLFGALCEKTLENPRCPRYVTCDTGGADGLSLPLFRRQG